MFSYAAMIRTVCAAALAASLAAAPVVHAGLIGEQVEVTLGDPSGQNIPPFSFSDLVPVGAGPEIALLNGTSIGDATFDGGALLLTNEYVDVLDSGVIIGVEAGGENNTTGYGPGSSWVIDFGPLVEISDVQLQLSNVDDVSLGSQITYTPHSLTVLLDTLTIPNAVDSCGLGVACGSMTVLFSVRAVPEPSTVVLLGLGLAGLLLLHRRAA